MELKTEPKNIELIKCLQKGCQSHVCEGFCDKCDGDEYHNCLKCKIERAEFILDTRICELRSSQIQVREYIGKLIDKLNLIEMKLDQMRLKPWS